MRKNKINRTQTQYSLQTIHINEISMNNWILKSVIESPQLQLLSMFLDLKITHNLKGDDWVWLMNVYFHLGSGRPLGRVIVFVVGNGRWQREWYQQRWYADSGRHRLGCGRRSRFGAHVRDHLLFQVRETDSCEERGCYWRCSPSSTSSSSPAWDQRSQSDCSLFASWRRSSTTAHAATPAAGIGTDSSSIPAAAA